MCVAHEVSELEEAVAPDEEVAGLEVAVRDRRLLRVEERHGRRCLAPQPQLVLHTQRFWPRRRLCTAGTTSSRSKATWTALPSMR